MSPYICLQIKRWFTLILGILATLCLTFITYDFKTTWGVPSEVNTELQKWSALAGTLFSILVAIINLSNINLFFDKGFNLIRCFSERLLHELLTELKISSNDVRITLYYIDSSKEIVYPLARFSSNHNYRKYKRFAYPANQGYISRVLHQGEYFEFYDEDPNLRKQKWQNEPYNMNIKVLNKLVMLPKYIAGVTVKDSKHQNIGLVLIESDTTDILSIKDKFKRLVQKRYTRLFEMLIDELKTLRQL